MLKEVGDAIVLGSLVSENLKFGFEECKIIKQAMGHWYTIGRSLLDQLHSQANFLTNIFF